MNNLRIREITAADLEPIVALFKDTVRHVNAKDYTSEQLDVWAPKYIHPNDDRWQNLLENIAYLVEIDAVIVGFADITTTGYLDRLFVHKDYQRQGIASMLVHKLESMVLKQGIKKITTEASITAKPFFEQMGYFVVREQNKPRPGGVTLTNFLMEKNLDGLHIKPNYFILTGGPGSGKTSVLSALAQRGFLTVPEVARQIIKVQILAGGNAIHTGDRDAFLELMLHSSLDDYQQMQQEKSVVFFDRGIPDLYSYAKAFCQKEHPIVNQCIKRYRYNKTALLFPPWEAIYVNDIERKQDFKESIETYQAIKEGYQHCGYRLIEIPLLPVEDRVHFILQTLKNDIDELDGSH